LIISKDCDKIQDRGTEGGQPFCVQRVDKKCGKGRRKEVEITDGA